jgi:PEGA domain
MFSRILRLSLFAALIAAFGAPSNAGVRLGTISVGFGYFNGPAYGPFCCYSPWAYDAFYGPYWGPFGPYYPSGYFSPGPDKGTVKLLNANKNAAVYIDNAYAGKVSELKTISIKPGAYDLELQPPGGKAIQKRIYVLSGKTLKLEF